MDTNPTPTPPKSILIETDPSLPLTQRGPLDTAGNKDTETFDRLIDLATRSRYDPEPEERAQAAAEMKALKESVPAWGEEPYAERVVFINVQSPYELHVRMHPDSVNKLSTEFLTKCEVRRLSAPPAFWPPYAVRKQD